MKPKILLIGAPVCFAVASIAQTILPTWKTLTATGTTSEAILFPQSANGQIRVDTCIETSDLATSSLTLYSGSTSTYVATANTNTSGVTNITVESTNGITSGDLIYIQLPGTNWVTNCTSVTSSNIGFGATLPTNVPANAEVEDLSITPPVILSVGAATNKSISSDALFVGNYGRAVYGVLNSTSHGTNYMSVHYDATSQ